MDPAEQQPLQKVGEIRKSCKCCRILIYLVDFAEQQILQRFALIKKCCKCCRLLMFLVGFVNIYMYIDMSGGFCRASNVADVTEIQKYSKCCRILICHVSFA